MSAIVFTSPQGGSKVHLAIGLRWVVLDPGVKRRKDGRIPSSTIRRQASTLSASKFVVLQSPTERAAGFYNDPVVNVPPQSEKIYSVSMLLLSAFIRQQPGVPVNAILVMQAERYLDKRVVVIILGGQVVLDALLDTEKALQRVQEAISSAPSATVFSQSAEISTPHTPINWENIAGLADKAGSIARLQPVPRSPFLVPALTAVVAVLAGFFAYDQMVRQPEAKRVAREAQIKADLTPAYVSAVNLMLQSSNWDVQNLQVHMGALRDYPIFTKGWALESLACEGPNCVSRWGRRGGTLADIQSALPAEQLVLPGSESASAEKAALTTLDQAFTIRVQQVKLLDRTRDSLPSPLEVRLALYTPFQKLGNSGIVATIGETSNWDGFSTASVNPAVWVTQTPISISAPFFRAQEVLAFLPPVVSVKSYLLTTDDGAMTIAFKGFVYARQ
jgi:hypothetical protein